MFLKSFHVGWDLRSSRTHCSESWLRVTMASCLLSALVAIALLCQAGDLVLSTLMSLPPQTVVCSTPIGLPCLEHDISLLETYVLRGTLTKRKRGRYTKAREASSQVYFRKAWKD